MFNTFKDAIIELLGLAMTKAKTVNPALSNLDSQQKNISKVKKDVMGYIGRAYDPILEKHFGKRVVLEVTTPEGETQEYVGIFKEYSSKFLHIMDVSYQEGEKTRICDIVVPRAHAAIRYGAEV